jgi:hypothetical protein
MKITIPNSITRIPLDKPYVLRKTIKKLKKYKFNIYQEDDFVIIVSW